MASCADICDLSAVLGEDDIPVGNERVGRMIEDLEQQLGASLR
jgi:hypothetical protein